MSFFLPHYRNVIQPFFWAVNLLNLMLYDNLLIGHLTTYIASNYRFLGIFCIFLWFNLRFRLRHTDLTIGEEYWLFVWRWWLDFSARADIANVWIVKLRVIWIRVSEILFETWIFWWIITNEGNVYVSVFYFNWFDLRSCSIQNERFLFMLRR